MRVSAFSKDLLRRSERCWVGFGGSISPTGCYKTRFCVALKGVDWVNSGLEIEQIAQKALALLSWFALVGSTISALWRWFGNRAVDDFVQLPAIQPDPTALRAIVNLDAASFTNDKCGSVDGAFHRFSFQGR